MTFVSLFLISASRTFVTYSYKLGDLYFCIYFLALLSESMIFFSRRGAEAQRVRGERNGIFFHTSIQQRLCFHHILSL